MDERNHTSSDHEEEEEEQSDYKEERSHLSDEQPQPPKRRSCETLDRISSLPESILLHTLSLLPMKEVVKTATLSKRWQYLWTSVPNLIFSGPIHERHCIGDFVSFVDKTLILCRQSKINKFTINFRYEPRFASHVNLWIRFATSCDAEKISIKLYAAEGPEGVNLYTLPKHLFRSSSLTKLGLWFCNVAPTGAVSWKSLKNLSIRCGKLSNDVIEKILSGSPALEFLEFCYCCGFDRLDINSASLRKCVVEGYRDPSNSKDESVLKISAPNLQSLNVIGSWYLNKFQLMNMSSLVDVDISFDILHDEIHDENENMLKELLQFLRDVNKLTVGTWCIKVMSKLELKGLPSPVSKCKCLKIDTSITKRDLPGIANLLQSSPNLETLIINMATDFERKFLNDTDDDCYNNEGFRWTYGKRTFKCLQLHLKTVKIFGFAGWHCERELPFIKSLLENALVLEKMIIYVDVVGRRLSCCGSQNIPQVTGKLFYFPRSSPNALVMFRLCRVK